ncbi:zinc ribbon domain-containing protein [Prevotella pallens]|uniref:zinc ribbon domain-containing protein n=1 Tax=Prevotella pallens TaxID=60133 RepID=UPI001CAE1376|nr:zinc ribbon domain-containing protein [Prevotella pallens]MBF1484338.1 zinc ribbon domain-containing protein [Prevotella pallens]MBF1498072.1 zinc ribbon domain-containing protein [Prevotella pallens]
MIIKCPECGHQVSDKAPICPSCGVEIAGHLIKCSYCGEIYLKEDAVCPNCHHSASTDNSVNEDDVKTEPVKDDSQNNGDYSEAETSSVELVVSAESIEEEPRLDDTPTQDTLTIESPSSDAEVSTDDMIVKPESKNNNHTPLFVSLLIALVICAVLLFFYKRGNDNHEAEEYKIALKSNNRQVMEQYLEDYPNAPLIHINSIRDLLKQTQQNNDEWGRVIQQNTIASYKAYLETHPNTPYKNEILKRVEELYWNDVVNQNTEAAYLGYREKYPKGFHVKEADEKLKIMLDNTSTPNEEKVAVSAVRQFLQGLNSKSTSKIEGVTASSFNFLGAGGATIADVSKYMREKLYQADVKEITWQLGTVLNATTDKSDDGTTVQKITIPARLEIVREGGKGSNKYTIKAQIENGKITAINWVLQR